MSNKTIKIGDKLIGDNQPCFFIAEIGSNHNGNFDIAKEMIDKAADAGVDAVKFQTFRAKTHYSKYTPNFNYSEEIAKHNVSELIEKLEIDWSWHQPLKDYSEKLGLTFMTSPCDYESIDLMEKIGLDAYKAASFDLPDNELISYMAKPQKPVILSTGLAEWADIQRGIQACYSTGNKDVVVLQCTSMYPAPIHLSNLKAMDSIRSAFNVLTGYSDHTMGDHITLAAVARGACMIEKHYTLDRTMDGPDHEFAIEPHELKELMTKLRDTEAAIGDGSKTGPRPEEAKEMVNARRSLHVNRDIKAGEIITADDIIIKRPNFGIPTHMKDIIIGRKAQKDIPEDHWIEWDMV